jgi:RimJ/RimL family protein N-acetyltransferase
MVPDFIPIETDRVRLRRLRSEDLATFLAYRNDPDVARYQSWETTSAAEALALFAEMQGLHPGTPGEGFQFAIAWKATDELIGDCMLYRRSEDPQQAEIGYTLARSWQGRGLATEALEALLSFAFETLSLHRVTARVDCRNGPSVRLLERLGMRREGQLLQCTWDKGEWCDEYAYALLSHEWHRRSFHS